MSISDKAIKAGRKASWVALNALSKDRASKPKILYSNTHVEEGQSPEYVHLISGPAYIEPQWGYVISASGRLWEAPLLTYTEGQIGQPWRFGIPSPQQFFRVHRQRQGRIVHYPKVISLRFIWEWNYYHFYADVLGKLSLLDEIGVDPSLPLVLGRYAHDMPFVQQIISQGGFKDRNWVIAEDTHILADEIIYATRRENLRQRYDYLLSQMKPPRPSGAEERVFLTRSKPQKRCILNNEEVSQLTQRWGFKTVDTAKMTIADQAALFSRTRYLIAAHGAGFINIIFRQDAPLSFLELHAENYLPGLSRDLADAYGHTWISLAGKPDDLDKPQSSNYHIDPDALTTKIEQILAS